MSSCEKCWVDSQRDPHKDSVEEYMRLVKERNCTPEEQAGPLAEVCGECGRKAAHQITGECMNCHKWIKGG